MRLRPGENPAQGWLINEDMQDRVVERGVAGVTVSIPVPHIEIHLDRSPAKFTVHLHRRFREIRSGPAVPVAELHHLDPLAFRSGEDAPVFAPEPACLHLQLIGDQARTSSPGHGNRLGPDRLSKPFVSMRRARMRNRQLHTRRYK